MRGLASAKKRSVDPCHIHDKSCLAGMGGSQRHVGLSCYRRRACRPSRCRNREALIRDSGSEGGTLSLEEAVWRLLKEIATNRDVTLVDLLTNISVLEEARKTGLTVDEEGTLIIEKPAACCRGGRPLHSIQSHRRRARIVVLAVRGRARQFCCSLLPPLDVARPESKSSCSTTT